MQSRRFVRIVFTLLILTASIGCDQVSKNMIRNNISTDESISLVDNHLIITKTENSGAFFGWGDKLPSVARNIILSFLPVLAISAGIIYLFFGQATSNAVLVGLSFILGGGIGNIFDRIIHGSVTDFLFIHYGIFRTGIFNLADVSIMTGTFIMVIYSISKSLKPTRSSY